MFKFNRWHYGVIIGEIVKWLKKLIGFILRKNSSTEIIPATHTQIKDWIIAIDMLVPLIQTARNHFDPAKLHRYDLDLFETNSYLYQVDRLVIKVREYILALRYHETQFAEQPEILSRVEFVNSNQACFDCYNTIINLILLFQRLPKNQLLSNEFVSMVQALELECSSLRSAIRTLNQFVTQYESRLQLNQIEKSLLQSLDSSKISDAVEVKNSSSERTLIYNTSDKLRQHAAEVIQEEDHKLLLSFINAYDMLRKCYVVARKSTIKGALDELYSHVDLLISEFTKNEIQKLRVFQLLNAIFNRIESLRFSTHRESRCSRNLFDKAKIVRHQLRKACYTHPITKEFVEEISLRRDGLLKDKKASK